MATSGDPDTGPRLDPPAWSEEASAAHAADADEYPAPEADSFTISRRGYDRQQVDTRIRALLSELATTEAAWQRESQRAAWAEHELRAAVAKLSQDPNTPEGFGHRVQKLLAVAEDEAVEIRAAATAEAAAILERARVDAETHRAAAEQAELARETALAQETQQRQMQLAERERQLTDQLVSMREEAAKIRAGAERDAERVRLDAQARAEELQHRSGRVIHQLHEMADQELTRVCSPYEAIRHELTRLHELFAGFGGTAPSRHRADPLDPPYPPEDRDPYGTPAERLMQASSEGGAPGEDGPGFRRLASAG